MSSWMTMVTKEWKEILVQKRTLSIMAISLIGFYYLLTNIEISGYHFLLDPQSELLPFLLLMFGCATSDFSFRIMNQEYVNKTIEIIKVSRVSFFKFMTSKIILPYILGVFIWGMLGTLTNRYFLHYYDLNVFHLDIYVVLFCILVLLISNLITVLISLRSGPVSDELRVFSGLVLFAGVYGLYALLQMNAPVAILIGVLVVLCMIKLNSIVFGRIERSLTPKTIHFFPGDNRSILLQNAFIHVIDPKQMFQFIILAFSIPVFLNIYPELKEIEWIVDLLAMVSILIISKKFLFNNLMLNKLWNINCQIAVSKCDSNTILLSYIIVFACLSLVPILVFILITGINGALLFKYFIYSMFIASLQILASMLASTQYAGLYGTLGIVVSIFCIVLFSIKNVSVFLIVLLTILLLIINQKLYKRIIFS
ncbi:MAG: hypothetical protein J6E46_06020 [Faecalicoccus sp.]|nr:hypothetical protein [Faecalicoccus sp.]